MFWDIYTCFCILLLGIWGITYNFIQIPIPISLLTISSTLVYLGSRYSPYASKDDVMEKQDAAKFPLLASATLFGLYILVKKIHFLDVPTVIYLYLMGISAFSMYSFLNELFDSLYNKYIKVEFIFILKWNLPLVYLRRLLSILCTSLVVYIYYITNHWMITNLFALILCFTVFLFISSVSIGTLTNGLILLGGLFLYDIFWVFGTEVMVTVATSIQGPIKFLFPKMIPISSNASTNDFSCLGLGDIAIPGLYIAFLYRYDIYRSQKSIEEFTQKDALYFNCSICFYILSMILTNVALYIFHHAQPAMLYIVPCLYVSTFIISLWYHDTSSIFHYNEEKIKKD